MEYEKFIMYVHELDNMTYNSIISFERAFYHLKDMEDKMPNENDNMNLFWYYMQTAIIYSGNVSKLLWPSYTRKKDEDGNLLPYSKKIQNYINERYFLRDTLQINEDSSVKTKGLRNRFEHIDEYMEDHNFMLHSDKNISKERFGISIYGYSEEVHRKKVFRHYVRDTTELIFYGKSVIVKNLYDDMIDIRNKVIDWQNKNFL